MERLSARLEGVVWGESGGTAAKKNTFYNTNIVMHNSIDTDGKNGYLHNYFNCTVCQNSEGM